MAIVRMKKLRVAAMEDRREALLQGLLRLGCVQLRRPQGEEWTEAFRSCSGDRSELRGCRAEVRAALEALRRYGEPDGQRRSVSRSELFDDDAAARAREACERVESSLHALEQLQSEADRMTAQRQALQSWLELDLPLEQTETAHTRIQTLVGAARAEAGAVGTALSGTAAEWYEVFRGRRQLGGVLIFHRAEEAEVRERLRPWNFTPVSFPGLTGTAAENDAALERALEENRRAQKRTAAELAAAREDRAALRLYADRLQIEADRAEARARLLTDGTVVFLEGWVPEERLAQVCAFLGREGCAWEAADPTEEEYPFVPVRLKNHPLTRPLNVVTDMYVLPAYDGIDPNPLMAPFFVLFYGLMMADMGYALLMLGGAWLLKKKSRPGDSLGNFAGLLALCGVSTLVWGALTGSFFGDFPTQLAKLIRPESTVALPYLFTPLTDTLMILVGSLALGVVQIFTGMAVSVVKKWKDGRWQDAVWEEFAWWAILIGGALAVLGIGNVAGYLVLLIAGIGMMLYGATRGRKGFAKITGIIGAVYNGVTGYFSDILSYARLMALMLAGAVIAQVFNTLGAVTGNVVLFLVVSLAGNLLNFALNLLGCYVHDLRLQCLEFFNRFYKEGGKPFRPLEMRTQYVDVIEEQ